MKKLSIDNPFFEFMGKLGDLILLNLIYLAACVPVITIGAARVSLYKVAMKLEKKECNYVIQEYLKTFGKEWKQSTKIWMILLIPGAVLLFDIIYMGKNWSVLGVCIGALAFLWVMLFTYVFPVQAQFENTVKNTLKNAWYMAVRHFPYTLAMVLQEMLPVFCFLMGGPVLGAFGPIYIIVGFALTAQTNAKMFLKIFQTSIDEDKRKEGL